MKTAYFKKLNVKAALCFTIVFVAAIIGCHKEIEKFGQTGSESVLANRGINIAMLQKAYNKGINVNSKLKTADVSQQTLANIISSLTVDWTSYTLFSYPDSTQVIEFTMPDDTSLLVPGQLAVHDSVKYQSKTAAVFIINQDTVTMSFFMKTIEDETAPGYQPVLNQLHYKQIPNTFTGNILYFSLSRQYLNGYSWSAGNITKAISLGAGTPQPPQTPANNSVRKLKTDALQLTNCVEDDYEIYGLTISGGQITYADYIGTIVVTTCDIVDDGNPGGTSTTISGGATGDNTTPNPNPCTPAGSSPAVESVKGKLVIDVTTGGSGGSSGGNTGGTTTPCSTSSETITNNLKKPCASKVLDDLINDDLNGQVANIIQNVFGSSANINLDFEEAPNTATNAPPATSSIPSTGMINGVKTYNETITLNSSQVSGPSQEYLASVIIHEVLHAWLNYNNTYYQNQFRQHESIAQNYVAAVRDLLQQEFDIDDHDANSLIMEGLSDIIGTSYYSNLLSSLNLTVGDIQTTSLLYKDGISGTSCK